MASENLPLLIRIKCQVGAVSRVFQHRGQNLGFRACKEGLVGPLALGWTPKGLQSRRKGEEEVDCMSCS